jgi:hypothetical protein
VPRPHAKQRALSFFGALVGAAIVYRSSPPPPLTAIAFNRSLHHHPFNSSTFLPETNSNNTEDPSRAICSPCLIVPWLLLALLLFGTPPPLDMPTSSCIAPYGTALSFFPAGCISFLVAPPLHVNVPAANSHASTSRSPLARPKWLPCCLLPLLCPSPTWTSS